MNIHTKIYLCWKIFTSLIRPRGGHSLFSGIAIMSLIGISLGVCVIITVMSVMNGFQIEIKQRMLNFVPHATIRLEESGEPRSDWLDIFKIDDDIESYSGFIEGEALVLSEEAVNPLRLLSYDNSDYLLNQKLASILDKGNYKSLFDNSFSIVIGDDFANKNEIRVGDIVRLLTNDKLLLPFGNIPRMKDFIVSGIFDSGIFEMDESIALIEFSDAEKFLQMDGYITGYAFDFNKPSSSRAKIKDIAKTIDARGWISDWTSENPNFFRSLDLTRQIIFLVLMTILTIACSNIISTQSMLIAEKKFNIATLIASGYRRSSIFYMFITLGSCLGLFGLFFGILLAMILSDSISQIVLLIERIFSFRLYQPEIYYLAELPSIIDWRETLMISLFTLTLSICSALLPAYNATKTDPAVLMKNIRFK